MKCSGTPPILNLRGSLATFTPSLIFRFTFLLLCLKEETEQTKKLLDEEREQKREMYFRQSRMLYPDKEEWILCLAVVAFMQQEENGPLSRNTPAFKKRKIERKINYHVSRELFLLQLNFINASVLRLLLCAHPSLWSRTNDGTYGYCFQIWNGGNSFRVQLIKGGSFCCLLCVASFILQPTAQQCPSVCCHKLKLQISPRSSNYLQQACQRRQPPSARALPPSTQPSPLSLSWGSARPKACLCWPTALAFSAL